MVSNILNRLVFRRSPNTNKLIAESEFVQVITLEDGSTVDGLGDIQMFSAFHSEWLLTQPLAAFNLTSESTMQDVINVFDRIRTQDIVLPDEPVIEEEEVINDVAAEV